VERIWLPFAVWLTAGAALLPPPTRRFWLIVQFAMLRAATDAWAGRRHRSHRRDRP
jgi:hypothetical protein